MRVIFEAFYIRESLFNISISLRVSYFDYRQPSSTRQSCLVRQRCIFRRSEPCWKKVDLSWTILSKRMGVIGKTLFPFNTFCFTTKVEDKNVSMSTTVIFNHSFYFSDFVSLFLYLFSIVVKNRASQPKTRIRLPHTTWNVFCKPDIVGFFKQQKF